ncbi:MAG: ribose 5-phosphate isomerase B [Candidatus Omnitrophica bacterium]|nr:ribose 5-phosphate isomerase B [Candidatus Omnitrophota bacterium]
MAKKIAIGADHGGYDLKEKIIKLLKRSGHRVEDVGTYSPESSDYPVFGFDAAKKVSTGKADRGIVICKSGIGMSIIANKLPGVRAALCHTEEDAVSSRKHNDANVLVLSATKTGARRAERLTKLWLGTRALSGRHARRVDQIKKLEKKVFKKL